MTHSHQYTQPELEQLIRGVVDGCVGLLREDDSSHDGINVTNFEHPDEMETQLIDKGIVLQEDPCSVEELMTNVTTILDETIRTRHQKCLNQLFHCADIVSVLGDWITSAINTSIYTFETAPVVTLLEQELSERYRVLLGWDEVFGTFPPGGSTSNLYGITCARTRRFPHVPQDGWQADDKPVVFCSEQAHYSTKKSAGLLGIGYKNCVGVKCDDCGRMIPSELRAEIKNAMAAGRNPFCIVSTCGTTLTGAIDPIKEIVKIGQEFNLWVHVDGALGGALIHSPAHRHHLDGVEQADSFSMNPHKMLGATQQCSAFMCRHPEIQCKSFSTNAAYLFNDDKDYDADRYDVGDKVFQCGRRPDCLKLWLLWRSRGDVGMAAYVDRAIERHVLFNDVVKAHPRFRQVIPTPSPVPCTCFWWVPQDSVLAELPATDERFANCVNAVIPSAKMEMMKRGMAVLTMSKLDDLPNFWRMVTNGVHEWTEETILEFITDVCDVCDERYKVLLADNDGVAI